MQNKSVNQTYNSRDVRILAKDIVYNGHFQMLKIRLQYRLFKGEWSAVITREIFRRGQAAGVILYDPILNKVVLTEQFRVGALADKASPWLLEIVAGVLDQSDTDLESLAKREIFEEAGLKTLAMMPICHYWASPGGCTEQVHLYCAKVDASKAGGVFGLADEHEDIRVVVMDVEDAFAALKTGQIRDAATIIAMQWLQLNLQMVKEMWKN
jgi:ADP-ribose pyrophosphatase